jgi:gluconokinase
MGLVLAVDVGTSSARAALYADGGVPLPGAQGQQAYAPRIGPDGAVELDADLALEAVAAAVDRALAARPPDRPVEAVGVSLFWHGLLGMDAQGRALTPIVTWADTRPAAAAVALRRRLDAEAVRQRTGAPLHPCYFPAKLRWLRERDAAAFARVPRWGGLGELWLTRLFGRASTSLSMASGTGLLDRHRGEWDPAVLEAAGIGPERLPPIGDAPLAGLRPAWAARWPALARVPWFPAWGDGACSSVGSGGLGPGRPALNLGTSAAVRLVLDAPVPLPEGLWGYRLDATRHVVGGATSEGGNLVAWWRALSATDDEAALERELATLPPDGHGLTVLPFLAGERSLGWQPAARGAIVGLTLATTRAQLLRALLEAVALRLAAIHARLAPLAAPGHLVTASGGALARSAAWARILVDALGAPLWLAREAEASCRGAALLAREGLGTAPPPAPVEGERLEPDPAAHARYRAARARQERLYEIVVASGES